MLNNEQIKEFNELTTRLAELAKETYSPDFNGKTERGENIYNVNLTVSVQLDKPVYKHWSIGGRESAITIEGNSFETYGEFEEFEYKINGQVFKPVVRVNVKEVLSRDVEIEVPFDVEDKEQYAKDTVKDMYHKCEIVLDSSDLIDSEIRVS